MIDVKKDILNTAPKNSKIADFYKIPSDQLIFPEIPGDEYIARIELPNTDWIPNSFYIWKNGKISNIDPRLVPLLKGGQ